MVTSYMVQQLICSVGPCTMSSVLIFVNARTVAGRGADLLLLMPHQPLFSNYVLSSWKTGPERRPRAPTLNPTDGEGAGRCVEGRLFRLGLFARWAVWFCLEQKCTRMTSDGGLQVAVQLSLMG